MQPPPAPAPTLEEPPPSVSLSAALGFVFRSEQPWMNILVAALLSLVPLAGPIALEGWHAEISQRLVRRHPKPIPTFDFGDFVHYLMRGLQPFAVRYVIALPLSFLMVIGVFATFFYMGALSAHGPDPSAIWVAAAIASGGSFLAGPPFAILQCAAGTRAELTEDFVKAFSPRDLLSYIRTSWWVVLVSHFALGFIAFFFGVLGLVACYVGAFVVAVVMQLAYVHLRWQIYERYVRKGGAHIEPKAPVWIPSELTRARAAWTAQQGYSA